jgi:hypothetical protein
MKLMQAKQILYVVDKAGQRKRASFPKIFALEGEVSEKSDVLADKLCQNIRRTR